MSLGLEERTVKALESLAETSKKTTAALAAIAKVLDELTTAAAQIASSVGHNSEEG